ncbi:MAG: hypothetical protein ACTSP4_17205 [Candidatus Hodarchaeales archaeon]
MFFKTNKKLRKRGEKLQDQLAKEMQVASAKLCEAIRLWANYNNESGVREKLNEFSQDIIKTERECDRIKDELITQIFSKGAYLVVLVDSIVNRIEVSMRRLVARKDYPNRIPHEMPLLADKLQTCTDFLQDALKFIKIDLNKAANMASKIEKEREAARELDFHVFGRLVSDDYSAKDAWWHEKISVSIIGVIEKVEEAGDYIRTMTVKYAS